MTRPVILCGLGKVGRRVLEYLRAAHLPVVVIDPGTSPADVPEGVRLLAGDCRSPEVLTAAGLAEARGVIVCTSDDLINLSAVLTARSLNAEVRIVVRLFNQNLIPRLGKAVTNVYALSVSALTAPVLALIALTGESLGGFGVPGGRRQVAEVTVTEGADLQGLPLADLAPRFRLNVLAYFPVTGEPRFLLDMAGDTVLTAGDRVVVCAEPRDLRPFSAEGGEDGSPAVRWAGWFRRLGRMATRTAAEIDRPVKLIALVLIGVVFGSTLIYHWAKREPLVDSFYHTISVVATSSDMRAEQSDTFVKVYVSVLRITGAALIAAFTAIVTNYLLRARLGGALELRRVPDSGHVVVCGLGNIGFRVVEELLRGDERVVVIEPARDCRFLSPARRLGAAVIAGDATVQEVLRQARADSARAVVIATGNDLANVEIALLVRDLNPRQRVVVRLNDPQLARTLREAANVRFALSVPLLAAPAFVAALFGDRVLGVFLVGGRLLAAVELAVTAGDPCLDGELVGAVATAYGLVPVALQSASEHRTHELAGHRLVPGEALTVISTLPALEKIFRRERV